MQTEIDSKHFQTNLRGVLGQTEDGNGGREPQAGAPAGMKTRKEEESITRCISCMREPGKDYIMDGILRKRLGSFYLC